MRPAIPTAATNSSSLDAARLMIAPRSPRCTPSSRSDLMVSLLVSVDRFVDHSRRNFALFPADDLDAFAFQILVDMKEVLHLSQIMLRKVGDVEKTVVIRIVARHSQDFVVGLPAVSHAKHSQWTAIDLAAGECRLVDVHEHVE